jgi:flagellar basal-body rod protein FlgB
MSDITSIDGLQGYLKLVNERQQLISANMANIDTPGYHTQDLDFQGSLRQMMNSDNQIDLQPASLELPGLPERPDGNNVNIDRESMLLSQTQLQYQLAVQLVKGQFHELLTAIKGES